MFPWAILFWSAVAVSVAWCGSAFVGLGIGEFYHPMAARGDLFHPLRQGAVAAPILAAIAMFSLWLWLRPLAPRIYLIGLSVLAVTAFLPLLPNIDSGYRQVYWIDENRYEIPWQYGPYNGSPDRGGKYFLVKVSVPDLVPRYETQGETIIIGKAVDYNYGKGGAAPEEMCTMKYSRLECQWQRGNFVFMASGDADLFPSEVSSLMVSASDLLDSFEVSAP
jgi:hypothetical protein